MITYIDNFLTSSDLDALNTRMLKRYKPGIRQDTGKELNFSESAAVRIRTTTNNHDYTESMVLLGVEILPAIKKISQTLVDLKYKNPEPYNIWFQYGDKNHLVGKHTDGTVRGKSLEFSISTLLYTHKYWENNWGGEFCVESIEILPKPNRLVIYSREHEHWIKNIHHTLEDSYMRMFLGVSWSTG